METSRLAIRVRRWWRSLLLLLALVGPGLITATADNDAGGIATYSLAGALFGYDLLWTMIPITILLILTMEMSARLGAVTGQGLADLLRERFGVKVTFWVLFMVLIANFGTVISEFSGIAASIEIFSTGFGYGQEFIYLKYFLIPFIAWVLYKIITEYDYKKIEKVFLLSIFFYLAYPISAWKANPNWGEAIKALFVPVWRFDAPYLALMIGSIGTTITPWMQFYLQSTLIEKGVTVKNYREAKYDVILGSLTTVFVAFCIVVACAVNICFDPRHGPINSIEQVGAALIPLAGPNAGFLFAFGLFNASIFGAAILPLSTAFAVCEGMGWERGMNKTYEEAPFFYWIFRFLLFSGALIVLVPGMSFVYLGIMRVSQVAQGLILPPFLYYLVRLGDDKNLLGEHVNGPWVSRISWICVYVLTVIDLLMLASMAKEVIIG
ncbi:MAG TPA: divalent metal cation transporter [Candidatus Ozemobacteraceae bacterium]|nr:divalent metal cation transporter [Candidatus Ozemobacteraceae bacterium]